MTQPVTGALYVEDPDGAIVDGYTVAKLYRGTTASGSFTAQVGSDITLVAGTRVYEFTDTSGTPDSWYRYVLYGTTPGTSDFSPAWQADVTTLLRIKQEANRQAGGGFDSVMTATGSTGYLIDAVLGDSARDTHYLEGLWIYRPSAAAAADKVRRVAHNGYTVATSRLAPSRAWSDVPASAEAYSVFHWAPPIDWPGEASSWDRFVADGLRAFQFPDEINLGIGDGVANNFSLANYGIRDEMIRSIAIRTYRDDDHLNYYDMDAGKKGRWWTTRENGPQGLEIILHPAPMATQYVVVETLRDYTIPYGDTDTTDCPFDLAVAATKWGLFAYLDGYLRVGKYTKELATAWQDATAEAVKVGAMPRPSFG